VIQSRVTAPALFLAMWLLGSTTSAQVQASATGMQVIVRIAPDNQSAEVDLTNTSNKEISAYAIAYDIAYPDGHHDGGERLADYLPSIIASQQTLGQSQSTQGGIQPNETRQELFSSSPKKSLSILTAAVDVVIYMDRTADVRNEDMFNLLVSDRAATAKAAESEASILAAAAEDENDEHPLQTAKTKLQETLIAQPSGSLAKGDIEAVIDNLGVLQTKSVADARVTLKAYASDKYLEQLMMSNHSVITRH
jgi:hypothetical protein